MWYQHRGVAFPVALGLSVLLCSEANALIVGRNAETKAAELEKRGKFKEAAVYRLAAARAFDELIIPFEEESVRAYSQVGNKKLAETCSNRAKVLYPRKVLENRRMYEHDLGKAGGDAVRGWVEQEAVKLLCQFAPIPLTVPSRLRAVEQKEKEGDWHTAADYREVSARVYQLITVPFFRKESKAAKDEQRRKHFQAEALKYLKLARHNFTLAAEDYVRAARMYEAKADARSRRLAEFCRRKATETREQAAALAGPIAFEGASASVLSNREWRRSSAVAIGSGTPRDAFGLVAAARNTSHP